MSNNEYELKAQASGAVMSWFHDDDNSVRGPSSLALTGDGEINRAVTFRAGNLQTMFGEMEVHGGAGKVATSDALTFERLLWADDLQEDNTAVGVGVVQHMLGDRLMLATDLSWSTDLELWRDGRSSGFDARTRSGAARWHRVDAKLIENDDFKWSVKGQMSVVDPGYAGNSAGRPYRSLAIFGERSDVSTEVAAFGATAAVSDEHVTNDLFMRDATRLKLGIDGLDSSFYAKTIERFAIDAPSQWTSTTRVRGASFDITPNLLAPSVTGALDRSPLIPQLISLAWETGAVSAPAVENERTLSLSALATWKTTLGETTAFYYGERQGRDVASSFAGDDTRLIDLSQAFSAGNWRFSLGASMSDFSSSRAEDAFQDKSLSGQFSIRYAPEHGPKFEAKLGRDHDTFAIDSDDLFERSFGTNLALSLDLSDEVQRYLDRRDTHLKLDFRHQLNQSEWRRETPGYDVSEQNADTLLLSFSTPL